MKKFLMIFLLVLYLFIISGCSSQKTLMYTDSFGLNLPKENDYVQVHLRRNHRFCFMGLYVLEYSPDNYNGVLGVQYPLSLQNSGGRLWSPLFPEGVLGDFGRETYVELPGEAEIVFLDAKFVRNITKSMKDRGVRPAFYDDVLKLFDKDSGVKRLKIEPYNRFTGKKNYLKHITFYKVNVIGSVGCKDVISWKRPPGTFSIAVLFLYKGSVGKVGYFYRTKPIVAESGDNIYIDFAIPIGKRNSEIVFKSISKTPFKN